jgi:hypothetical protein
MKMMGRITTIIAVSLALNSNLNDADVPNRLFEFIQYNTRWLEPFYQQLLFRKDLYAAL